MKIAIIGTGYVGLVTGVCLSEIGHDVTCLDINNEKIEMLKQGVSPIYEPGLDELIAKNLKKGTLQFVTNHVDGLKAAEVIYIAVGTPQAEDGAADLSFIFQAARDIGLNITRDVNVVTKSTVPLGTNYKIKELIIANSQGNHRIEVVSNPEFLREGSAAYDTFHGDRIVIGAQDPEAADLVEEINKPFGLPVIKTSISSAEMIKYAANAFLATKISFINEIATLSEKVGADIMEVAKGIGMDARIGSKFLNAGIGYGGSCFPKDTKALIKIAEAVNHDFSLLKSVIHINEEQKTVLVKKAKERFGSLKGKRIALIGLSFKPNTDDMRESASINISYALVDEGAELVAYDPIATENAKEILPDNVKYVEQIEEAIKMADIIFLLTDWKEIVEKTLIFSSLFMEKPIIFDGRNCYTQEEAGKYKVEYVSIGREPVKPNGK
ncbi:UDP-glucose/GDP-mannose dehydrogenase family protein [Bacillus sp. HNG]|uniref:UDP-glucose dehydrogenase family protein n=1 Tax=Bacillus sp. HNG TaxID=2293325 RepID=UPI000E2E6F02|nr:UDP-glucose/GDP-mannose dehydrogenase family protein [Bacillus sp. HNG]RFB18905.1 UDP-glucose/GDP-mannose dehydrogenase family protein [Bacillus sp. HNG]